jgi:hypothetical protein
MICSWLSVLKRHGSGWENCSPGQGRREEDVRKRLQDLR